MSATIVARRYLGNFQIKFVTARSLPDALQRFKRTLKKRIQKDENYVKELDIFVVDVEINRASIEDFAESAVYFRRLGIRVLYFDSHSNKYNGITLLPKLEEAGVKTYLGQIGTAAASVIQDFMGTE